MYFLYESAVGFALFELLKKLGIVSGKNFNSVPILILLIGFVLLERHNLLKNLLCHRIFISEFVINSQGIIATIDSRILAAEHIHSPV